MKLSLAAILGGFSTAKAQNQSLATWFSTSTAPLNSVSTWRVVHHGSTPVTPIPTSSPLPVYERVTIHEPTRSRNINITTTLYSTQATYPVKTEVETVYQTSFGFYTVTANGTGTAGVWATPTIATITVTPIICANNATSPRTTVTHYTGEYTPFPGQYLTATRTSFPTAVTSYSKVISHVHIFTYTGITSTYTTTVPTTAYSTTTTTTTLATTLLPYPFPPFILPLPTHFSTTTTTTTYLPRISYTALPKTAPCPATTTPTITQDIRCAPTNLISARDGRGITVASSPNTWGIFLVSRYGEDVMDAAGKDASVCCQVCVDNGREGCLGSEWKAEGGGKCWLWFWCDIAAGGGEGGGDGGSGDGNGGNGSGDGRCGGGEDGGLVYFGGGEVWEGQGSFVQGGCRGLRYGGVRGG
ncbi:hypothetical protein QBC34DRAFT_458778 [Podospora aff. communis PSN243]|uniref:Apple domain-containing protein n=1 Tax=Podospora aff. communis PSN243 TaxID=3040156 RepID=A0AAV9GRF1_9PEZI|nr:hypothetical protein QBC34DRAFT_458778 [Podospora aff. communis PSN243]